MSCGIYLYGKHAFIRRMRSVAPFATYRIDIKFSQHVRFISTRNKFIKKKLYFFSLSRHISLILPWMEFQLDQNWRTVFVHIFTTTIVHHILHSHYHNLKFPYLCVPCEFALHFFLCLRCKFDFIAAVTNIAQNRNSFRMKIFHKIIMKKWRNKQNWEKERHTRG